MPLLGTRGAASARGFGFGAAAGGDGLGDYLVVAVTQGNPNGYIAFSSDGGYNWTLCQTYNNYSAFYSYGFSHDFSRIILCPYWYPGSSYANIYNVDTTGTLTVEPNPTNMYLFGGFEFPGSERRIFSGYSFYTVSSRTNAGVVNYTGNMPGLGSFLAYCTPGPNGTGIAGWADTNYYPRNWYHAYTTNYGQSWTSTYVTYDYNFSGWAEYINGAWYRKGAGGIPQKSTDMINWTSNAWPSILNEGNYGAGYRGYRVTKKGIYYYVIDNSGRVQRSSDLSNWTQCAANNPQFVIQKLSRTSTSIVVAGTLEGNRLMLYDLSEDGSTYLNGRPLGPDPYHYTSNYALSVFDCLNRSYF